MALIQPFHNELTLQYGNKKSDNELLPFLSNLKNYNKKIKRHKSKVCLNTNCKDHIKLKTVYIPNQNNTELIKEINAYKNKLKELNELFNETKNKLINDKNECYIEINKIKSEYNDKFSSLQNEIKKLNDINIYNIKEYLKYKRQSNHLIYNLKNEYYKSNKIINELKNNYKENIKNIKKKCDKNTKLINLNAKKTVNEFRKQNAIKNEKLNNVTNQLNGLKKDYKNNIKITKQKINLIKKNNIKLKKANKFDKQGYKSDIYYFKNELKNLQKKINNNNNTIQDNIVLKNQIKIMEEKLLKLANQVY